MVLATAAEETEFFTTLGPVTMMAGIWLEVLVVN